MYLTRPFPLTKNNLFFIYHPSPSCLLLLFHEFELSKKTSEIHNLSQYFFFYNMHDNQTHNAVTISSLGHQNILLHPHPPNQFPKLFVLNEFLKY